MTNTQVNTETLYAEDLLEEAREPSCYGLDSFVQEAGQEKFLQLSGAQYNASCGDSITVQIYVDAASQKIAAIRWEGAGCIVSQASMSIVSRSLEGKSVTHILSLDQEAVLELLGLTQITMGRLKCLMLGVRAIQKVIRAL